MKTLTFEMSRDEANLALKGLGMLPYNESFQLVAKLQQQAQPQLIQAEDNGVHKIDRVAEAVEKK